MGGFEPIDASALRTAAGAGIRSDSPSAEVICEELQRLLNSVTFATARAQKKFLQYTVTEALEGRGHLLKEFTLGVEVFGRGQSFDPRTHNIVRVEASKLRAKLARYYATEGRGNPLRIEFPKGSYAPVFHGIEWLDFSREPASEAVRPQAAAPSESLPWLRRHFQLAVAFAALTLVMVAGAVVFRVRGASVESNVPSVAVLPFVNLNNDGNDLLSDGITEDLLDSLARVPGVRVVARNSSFGYKGKSFDLSRIGRDLKVRTVLEGTVRQVGSRLRITARLANTADGSQLWSESFERETKDVLAVQHEIAASITAALGVQLARNEAATPSRSSKASVNPEAYQAYLKGRYLWNKNAPEPVRAAIRYFEQAIRTSPDFALPYTGLGHAYTALLVMTAMPSEELVPKIRSAASKALELDPTLGEAHLDLAETFLAGFDWPNAEREFKKALALSPSDAVAHRYYAFYLEKIGRFSEATSEVRKALDLDPISTFVGEGLGDALYYERRYTDAAEQYRSVLELDGSFGFALRSLGRLYIRQGRFQDGIEQLRAAGKVMESDPMTAGELAQGYALSGRRPEARAILQTLLTRSEDGRLPALAISKVYFALGDNDRGFQWLSRSVEEHELTLDLKSEPLFDTVRADPRFAALLLRMNLS
jgi:TolB-like protein/Tfp pilus assembly protein PilF